MTLACCPESKVIELYKEIIQIMGQIAGIGGLSLAMILILFRDIIQKKIFPKLTRAQSVSLLKYIIIVAGCIAFIGLLSWVVVSIYEQKQKAPLSLIDVVDNSNSNNKNSNYPIDLSGIRWYYPVIINDISKNSISDDVNLERDFPVKFGDNIETVHKKLGMPQETSSIIESYYSEGLRICYDRYTSQVDGFLIQYLESGSVYSGKVLGVRIGDSYAYAKKILGNPIAKHVFAKQWLNRKAPAVPDWGLVTDFVVTQVPQTTVHDIKPNRFSLRAISW